MVVRVLDAAVATVRRVYREIYSSLQEDAVIDLVVNFDGSSMTPGHTSAHDCVTDTVTGLCVALAVLASYCQLCSYARNRFGKHSPEVEEWFGNHRSECNRNFGGSAGGMEAAAAE